MRLIDADALIPMMKYATTDSDIGVFPVKIGFDAIVKVINAQPTIKPRPRGRWIDEGFYADGHGAHAFRCSECGGHIIEYEEDPFCRWCGADMRQREEEHDER